MGGPEMNQPIRDILLRQEIGQEMTGHNRQKGDSHQTHQGGHIEIEEVHHHHHHHRPHHRKAQTNVSSRQ